MKMIHYLSHHLSYSTFMPHCYTHRGCTLHALQTFIRPHSCKLAEKNTLSLIVGCKALMASE